MKEILWAPSEYRDTIECPNCGGIHTNYIETITKPCDCVWKTSDEWEIYECEECKIKYGIKK